MKPIVSSFGAALAVVLSAAPFVTLAAAAAHAKLTPAQKCAAAKEKATAKKAAGKINCYRKTNLVVPADPVCLQKAEDTFVKAFAKAEKPGACDVIGDADGIETQVDTFVNALVQALQPAARASMSPELKCALKKITAAKDYDTHLLNCNASASTSSQGFLANCRMKAGDTFDAACTKAEAQSACNTTCDAIKNLVNMFVTGATSTLVPPTATPTLTPTVTRTPTRTPTPTFTPTPHLIDNGNGTITDNQTGLMWEKKDRSGGPHFVSGFYTWAGECPDSSLCQPNAAAASACSAATGGALGCAQCSSGTCNVDPKGQGAATTIWEWLVALNNTSFAGHNDWRIPTVGQDGGTAQLETILSATYPNCTTNPCVSPVFNTGCTPGCTVTSCSCTLGTGNWSATTYAANPQNAWQVEFEFGRVEYSDKNVGLPVRAVR
jgi:hypothetical protein